MKSIDFMRLNTAIDGLVSTPLALLHKNENRNLDKNIQDSHVTMESNFLTLQKVPDDIRKDNEIRNNSEEKIHSIDVVAIRDAIKDAISNRKSKKNIRDKLHTIHIEEVPVEMCNDKLAVIASSDVQIKQTGKTNKDYNTLSAILKNTSRNYLTLDNKPITIYDTNHSKVTTQIYAAGIINAIQVVQTNFAMRNPVHFATKCQKIANIKAEDVRIALSNNFDITCHDHVFQVEKMPLCEECCKLLNLPNLSDNSDFVAVFGLVSTISVSV